LSSSDSSAICLDFGHFTIQSGQNQYDQKDDKPSEDVQVLNNFIIHSLNIFLPENS
jgi:hypothetical protein